MENLDQDFKKLARKTKRRRWLLTFLLVLVTVFVLVGGGLLFVQRRTEKNLSRLRLELILKNTLLSPNYRIPVMGGSYQPLTGDAETVTGSKNIDGYLVKFGEAYGSYNWRGYEVSRSGLAMLSASPNYEATFDSYSGEKIPQFYNVKLRAAKTNFSPTQQLSQLATMENYVGEVALTFDQDYSYAQIQQMLPENVMINWYWFTPVDNFDPNANDTQDVVGIQGEDANGSISEKYYGEYLKAVKSYQENFALAGTPIAENTAKISTEYASLTSARFAGVIVTGKTENLAQLVQADWLFASSVGSTVERVPYLTPTK
ncbi:anti sigma factor C-terminal domain-containing protein [Enterococcus nangangensis]|uniref:anti sigma factor C-terminal domain-containing protein n=1 Tax=Enterococcus nangangensis TaxID=2559926 RepID=UPI0010F4A7BC|nr:anti sigma factor C-terminal domain-containing protein [Enterococcus nangangensis]